MFNMAQYNSFQYNGLFGYRLLAQFIPPTVAINMLVNDLSGIVMHTAPESSSLITHDETTILR